MRVKLFIAILVFLGTRVCFAGGAAVQRQRQGVNVRRQIQVRPQGVRVHRQIQVTPQAPGAPQPVENPAPKKAQPVFRPKRKNVPQKVLVSSSLYQDQRGADGAQNSAEDVSRNNWAYLFQQLDQTGQMWVRINDQRMKALVVARYVEVYRQEGVTIKKSPPEYVVLIDDMARSNPQLLMRPFKEVLRMAAVTEYDFRNGQDPDWQARSLLGEQAYMNNKKRLGIR